MCVGAFAAVLATSPLQGGPLDPGHHPYAEHAVDDAWEVYHRAALGGTVASPALQVTIEQHLHDARTLVTQMQEAAERGETRQVKLLADQIQIHTSHAIEGSKEHKK